MLHYNDAFCKAKYNDTANFVSLFSRKHLLYFKFKQITNVD